MQFTCSSASTTTCVLHHNFPNMTYMAKGVHVCILSGLKVQVERYGPLQRATPQPRLPYTRVWTSPSEVLRAITQTRTSLVFDTSNCSDVTVLNCAGLGKLFWRERTMRWKGGGGESFQVGYDGTDCITPNS